MNTAYALHISARYGLGAKPGELNIIANDPRGWLVNQLRSPIIPSEVKKREGGDALIEEDMEEDEKIEPKTLEERRRAAREVYIKETGARMLAQVRSNQPFIERLVMFWSNHFTISIDKPNINGIVNQYEVEAIRPYMGGKFRDMLLAVYHHPGMLMYLDNIRSYGVTSKLGSRRGRGLNENLAREILELHTLGVGNGYTQGDVIELANIITGWSFDRSAYGEKTSYAFNANAHQPGDKTLLGITYPEDGEQEGIEALSMLANHPATAKHIATKLARHFISETPSPLTIETIASSFLESDGHLPTVMQTVINFDEGRKLPLTKLKNPYEYVISALRLTGMELSPTECFAALKSLNFMAFNAPSPAGYDDDVSAWAAPDAIMKRVEWGYELAQQVPAGIDPLQLANIGLGDALTDNTRQAIEHAPSGTDGIGLLLSSPEFQRR